MNAPSHTKPLVAWASDEVERRRYPSVDQLIFIKLANYMNGERKCWPALPRLADQCACSERHVRRALRRFEADGLINTERGAGRRNTSVYVLAVDPLAPGADLFDGTAHAPSQKRETLYSHRQPERKKRGLRVPISGAPKAEKGTHSPPLSPGKGDSLRKKRGTQSPGNPPLRIPQDSALRAGTAVAVPPDAPPAFDPRKVLWTDGVDTLRGFTGQTTTEAKRAVGKLLKVAGGDATAVLRALEVAAYEKPYEPIPWITAAIKARAVKQASPLDELRERWNLPTFITPGGAA